MQLHLPTFTRLAVILSLAGLAVGFGGSWLMTPMYISQAGLQLKGAGPGRAGVERLIRLEQQVLSRTSLRTIIQNPRLDLYAGARTHTPLEDVIEQMRTRDIQIRIMRTDDSKDVPLIIRFIYPDPVKARDTLQALVTKLHAAAGEGLDVLDPPSLAARSARPNRAIFAAFGFGAGFVLAILIAVFRRTPPAAPMTEQAA